MPTSKKQTKANQKNAQKSTGPKTDQGKTKAAKNSVKHGLYARDVVIDSPAFKENPEAYRDLLQSLCEDFLPVGHFEIYLVEKIANALWRSRRGTRAETARINEQLKEACKNENANNTTKISHDLIGVNAIPEPTACRNILRYEMRLDRQLTRAYSLLLHLQARRKQEFVKNLRNGEIKGLKTNPFSDNEQENYDLQEIPKNR